MSHLDIGKLRGMKYAEIKEIAKSMNIRANVKADVLINAIMCHIKLTATPTPKKEHKRTKKVTASVHDETLQSQYSPAAPKFRKAPKRRGTYEMAEESIETPQDSPPAPKSRKALKRRSTYEMTEKSVETVDGASIIDAIVASPAAQKSPATPKRRRTYDLSPDNSFLAAELAVQNTPTNGQERFRLINNSTPKSMLKSRLRKNVSCKSACVQTTPVSVAEPEVIAPKLNLAAKEKSAIPRPVNRRNIPSKVAKTPNFKAIHSRAFKKLESVDEVIAKRSQKLTEIRAGRGNLKSIRTFGGASKLPKVETNMRITRQKKPLVEGPVFRPTIFKLADTDFNFANVCPVEKKVVPSSNLLPKTPRRPLVSQSAPGKTPFKISENAFTGGQPKRLPFNLQESLNRKLGYVPHFGPIQPLKPIAPRNVPEEVTEREDKRVKNREVLRGVRRNKRFELQLKARGINI